ncbi:MAG: bifunctional methylenetetrahydrofolate dehydrogenase/methenyltetrahydrofolate cyclohydrolase FolD [Negativicutes bacterium]|jgi:methylenetetrahydrofolate dehydrogenase (NADP+)/methenyltetrahydrofolate cyclohydrolase
MSTKILYGKPVAEKILAKVRERAKQFESRNSRRIKLTVILIGENPASQIYVKRKHQTCIEHNIDSDVINLPASIVEAELISLIRMLNKDKSVDGILVQLPLPEHIREQAVISAIDPDKDVDGFHAMNTGNLFSGYHSFVSCTPAGVMEILDYYAIKPEGSHAVVVGRSNIVGKPMAMLLLEANATVTICHSKTKNLSEITKTADIVVAAIGRPNYITAAMLKPGAVVIDVGINRLNDKIVGDCDYSQLLNVASAITPVPGGVGVLTIAMLLNNTVRAAERCGATPGYLV